MKAAKTTQVPAEVRPAYDAVVSLTDRFCIARLTHEYQFLCRELTAVLARKRPSPLLRGKPEVWACAVIRVIGWVNFLDDSSQKLHMKLTAIDKAFGVAESTGQGKAKAIRDLLKIRSFDPEWTLPSRVDRLPRLSFRFPTGLLTIQQLGEDEEADVEEKEAPAGPCSAENQFPVRTDAV